ncbi:hypothetical protein D3C81_1857510 [compost metagenome]
MAHGKVLSVGIMCRQMKMRSPEVAFAWQAHNTVFIKDATILHGLPCGVFDPDQTFAMQEAQRFSRRIFGIGIQCCQLQPLLVA